MVNDCLKNSVTIYDSSDNLLEVLCLSNPIFSLECANKGYKFRMQNGAILDTNQYEFKHGVGSDISGTGNIHYSAKPKQALSIPATLAGQCEGTLITFEGGAVPGPWPSYPPDDVCWLVQFGPPNGRGCDYHTYYTLSGYQCGMSGDQCVTGGWLPGDKRASCKLPDPIPPTPAPDPSCNSENCCLLPSMSIMGWKGDCSYFHI